MARKLLESSHHIKTMNIVADLFTLVPVHGIGTSGLGDLQQVGKEAMQLDARVRRPGQASAAKYAHAHAEVPAVLLSVNVGGNFRGTEQRMQRAIDAAV